MVSRKPTNARIQSGEPGDGAVAVAVAGRRLFGHRGSLRCLSGGTERIGRGTGQSGVAWMSSVSAEISMWMPVSSGADGEQDGAGGGRRRAELSHDRPGPDEQAEQR